MWNRTLLNALGYQETSLFHPQHNLVSLSVFSQGAIYYIINHFHFFIVHSVNVRYDVNSNKRAFSLLLVDKHAIIFLSS